MCANYKTYYSTYPENKGDVHSKNVLYETYKKINLPKISIKNNIKLPKQDKSDASRSKRAHPPPNGSKDIENCNVCICMHKII